MSKVYFNKVFQQVNETDKRYVVCKGSAGSGKSVNICQMLIIKMSDIKYKGMNILVVRKFETSNRDSTFAELTKAINLIFGKNAKKYWTIQPSLLRMKCKITGNEIIFRGCANDAQREKIKSINFSEGKLTTIFIEEATELLQNDFFILDDRLRGKLSNHNLHFQIYMALNPTSPSHWIKKQFFDRADDDVLLSETTYLDNEFIDEAYHKRMDKLKELNYEHWLVYACGQWADLEGLILKDNWKMEEIPKNLTYDKVLLAQDFGYQHSNCILRVGFRDCTIHGGDIYVLDELYVREKDTAEIIQLADQKFKNYKNLIMYCDSAEPDRIKTWRKAGWKSIPATKGAGSVLSQIDILKKCRIHISPKCPNLVKELQAWKYKKNKITGEYDEYPVEIFDDAIAALRYSLEELRQEAKIVETAYVDY